MRVQRALAGSLVFFGLMLVLPLTAEAHIVWGDVTVVSESGEIPRSPTFMVTLLNFSSGIPFGRDTVGANGRFRFNGVPNGEFTLLIETGDREVYRETFVLFSNTTDYRIDVEFKWTDGGPTPERGVVYARSADGQERMTRAQRAMTSGDLGEAARLLNALVSEDSSDYEAWTELGTVEFQRRRFDEAVEAYLKAAALRSDYLPAHLNLGKLYLTEKKYPDAILPLSKAVELDPGRAEGQYLLGEAYLGIKKGSVAVGYLDEAIRLDPEGMAEVHLRLAKLYDGAGYKDRAATQYGLYLQKRPDSQRRSELERYIARNRRK